MRAVANHFSTKPVVFAGHSAGALAAVLAAADHPQTLGIVLLDYVDKPPLGTDALRKLDIPAVAFFGEPSSCNANVRALPTFKQRNTTVVEQFDSASHCAFESPTSRLCRLLCASGKAEESQMQRRIIDRAVKALIGLRVQTT